MFNDIVYNAEHAIAADFGFAISPEVGVSASGENGISIVGPGGVAKSGVGGILIFLDDSTGSRLAHVFYVGTDGVSQDQFYEFDGREILISDYDE